MELLADRDPEEARKILEPVLEHMLEAVHRYEGTVNQVMGDGIMAQSKCYRTRGCDHPGRSQVLEIAMTPEQESIASLNRPKRRSVKVTVSCKSPSMRVPMRAAIRSDHRETAPTRLRRAM